MITDKSTNTDTCCNSHMQGKMVLKDLIVRLQHKAKDLQTLHDMLPEKPTPEQDEALWKIAININLYDYRQTF